MSTENNLISIEVAYAALNKQSIITLKVEGGTTILSAIQQSHILNQYPEIDLTINKVGIFGKKRELNEMVKADERIEIYRELITDPKKARMERVKRVKKK